MTGLSLDEAFDAVGNFGRYQMFYFLFIGMCGMSITFQMFHNIFVAAKSEFECLQFGDIAYRTNTNTSKNASSSSSVVKVNLSSLFLKDNNSINNNSDQCSFQGLECTKFRYTSNFTSIVTEWDLVCGDSYEASLGQSIFMAGVMTGAAFYGPIADIYGRKKTFFLTFLFAMVSSACSAVSSSVTMFLAFRFLSGFNCAGAIIAQWVLLMEIVGTDWRASVSFLLPIFSGSGVSLLALLAWAIPDWRSLALVYALYGCCYLPFFYFVLESPRWLYGRGRIAEAEEIFFIFAKRNKSKITDIRLEAKSESHKSQSASLFKLAGNWTLFRVTGIQFYTWMVNCIVYYGTTMGAGDLGGNRYVSVILSGLVEIPSNLAILVILKFVGRRTTCVGCMLLCGFACLCIMFVPFENVYTINALALTGKISISASFSIIYLWSSEIFPTVMRNGAMGLMSVGARFGGIISPFINLLSDAHPSLPYIVFGILAISTGVLDIFLPETRGRILPQTIDDMLRLCTKSKKGESAFSDSVNIDEQRIQLLEKEILDEEVESDEVVEYERTAMTPL